MTMTRLAAAGAVIVALAAAAWLWTPTTVAAGGGDDSAVPVAPVPGLTVHVSGEVAAPGLVELHAGARIADAVAAAGGTLRSADLSALNLAAPVRDGEQIHVAADRPDAPPAAAGDDGRVHINRAAVSDLEALPGVGPVLAGRIFAYREEHGPFASAEDLLDVPGIGEAKLAAMRDVLAIP